MTDWIERAGDAMCELVRVIWPWVCGMAVGMMVYQVIIRPRFYLWMGWG